MFDVMNMRNTVNRGCANKLGENVHMCLEPYLVYDFNTENMFITQVFDYTFIKHVEEPVGNAYSKCFMSTDCSSDKVDMLNGYLKNFTSAMKASPNHGRARGQGAYLSTCTKHTFYLSDLFWTWKNGVDSVGDAQLRWWNSLNSEWYW